MPKHRGYASDDSQSEPAHSDDDLESVAEGYEEPLNPQQRKRAALHPPISSICAALGGYEEFLDENGQVYSAYSLGDQVVGCLKDLKRFWRMDEKDDDRTVARIFHEVGVLAKDLIPILKMTLGTGNKGDRIALACVELIGAMTWPINVAEELRDAQLLGELKQSMDYTTLIAAQRSYKAAILKEKVLKHMMIILANSLSKNRRERTPKDENVISLVLHVFRNLAYLTDRYTSSTSASAIEDSSLQSDLIVAFEREGILDLLLAMSSQADSSDYAPWNMVVLDILHLLYRGVRAEELLVPEQKVEQNRLRALLDVEAREQQGQFGLKGSRHSRFGTTIAVQSNGKKYILHKQSTLAEGPERTLDKIKRSRAKRVRQDDDLAPPCQLRPEAVGVLARTSRTFIESAFNPFFSSVLRDIRMERLKVRESDTVRFLYLSAFFLDFFLLVYRDDEARGISHLDEERGHDFGMIAELTEPHAIGFVTMRMKNALEEKPPLWTDLHAGVECFTQMLLVIEALQATGNQDHIDVAEILQNKLYYEAETLDMVVNLVTRYNAQSYKYLDAVLNLAYTLLRMLEKYSKSKAYMYVRKKKAGRAAKKKKKQVDENGGDGLGMEAEEDEEELEIDAGTVSFGEHAFQFEKFEQRFADESVLATCMIYLESYKTFRSPEQMKRIVALMHRQAVKAKSEGLFYKPSVLELFRRLMEDRDILDAREGPNVDLRKLIEYVLRRFFKAVKEHPALLLECFFPKTKGQLGKMRLGEADPYADSDDDTLIYKAKKVGEVEVQPGFSHTQQIGIAIAVLVDNGDQRLVDLIKDQLKLASAARTEIVLTTDGLPAAADPLADLESDAALREKAAQLKGPSSEALALFQAHNVDFGEDAEVKEAATINAHFKLLMRLLSWESADAPEVGELTWSIPASLVPTKLDADLKIIDDFLLDPVDPQNGKSASELLRKQRKKPVRRRRQIASEDEMEIGSDGEAVVKPKEKKKRQRKRQEEEIAYKSAQFIHDSDDDDDADRDAAFFAAEQALRDKLNAGAISTALDMGTRKKKQPKAAAGKAAPSSSAAASKRATSPADSLDSSPPPAAAKKGRRSKKPAKKTKFDTEQVSDIDDDDELVSELRQEADKQRAAASDAAEVDSDGGDGPARGATSSPSTSDTLASGRKRSASASSISSAPAADTAMTSDEDEPVGAVSQAKKRRVIADSDDED
ncbi:Tof1p [Rhodotorula paludigena]|uniref:Tof1p n=1 Tax=Rhodotorula paludigena TaxID=86838 RepID=UPI003171B918